jgi:hypothetical protein
LRVRHQGQRQAKKGYNKMF